MPDTEMQQYNMIAVFPLKSWAHNQDEEKKRGKRVNNILVTEDRGKMNAQGKSRSCASVHVYKQTLHVVMF